MPNENTVTMEGVQIIFRNFAGKEGQYNREGDRNFGILLSPEDGERMLKRGWNVKFLKPREDEEEESEPQAWLPVSVKYDKGRPPRVVQVTSTNRRHLDEDEVAALDWADILNVDLIVRPYTWEVQGKTGVKAYLQSMYVTIEEDELERKYNEMDSQ